VDEYLVQHRAGTRSPPKALVQTGVDVLAQHTNSKRTAEGTEENDIWGIGYNTDMSAMAPTSQLTSAIWDWARSIPVLQKKSKMAPGR
jgi:basic membrane protein A